MIPEVLAFVTTYRCNFLCDHCSLSAGPNRREVLSIHIMRQAIEQAYDLPSIRLVVFTGGEPTLCQDLLYEGIGLARKKGFFTRLVTNGWWAQTPERAREFLQNLQEVGLTEINISYDDFHSSYLKQYGGEQNIINAVMAAIDLKIDVLIGVTLYPGAKIRSSYLRDIFNKVGISQKIKFLEDYVFPLGRARQKLVNNLFPSHFKKREEGGCEEAGHTLTVLPNGEVLFCCGHIIGSKGEAIMTVDSLSAGVSLPEIVERMQRNVFYWWLHLEGPEAVLSELGVEKNFYRKCEACLYIGTACKKKLESLADRKEEIFARWEGKNWPINLVSGK